MDVDYSYDILHNLKNIGVEISMDDFGTGYSSLGNSNFANIFLPITKHPRSWSEETIKHKYM
ncbi:hypothetical protein [Peribacillus glennii]|uniref:EAL domain-containing protein n=1 Tax=Peribacillus glennii TaxID=2303991 RepID=A0A372LJK2_9BACI|nr:hypothetical protein [Peribacillus glennii]RFU66674.1 hypothetical protein D0466_00740 [Peribacillus glennii]